MPLTRSEAPADVVRAVGVGVGRLVTGGPRATGREALLDALAGLYAPRTDVRHPFALWDERPMATRAEVRAHFGTAAPEGVERFEPADVRVHTTGDPEVVVVEFRYVGSTRGRQFALPCVFVVRVRDGLIVESRDYTHHVAFAEAFGRLGELTSALGRRAGDTEPTELTARGIR